MVQKPQIERERGGIPVPLGERETAREVEEGKEKRRIDDVTSFSASENQKGREREREKEREREVIFPFRAAVSLNVSASPRGVTDIPSSSTSTKRSPGAGLPAHERCEKGLEGREERGEMWRRKVQAIDLTALVNAFSFQLGDYCLSYFTLPSSPRKASPRKAVSGFLTKESLLWKKERRKREILGLGAPPPFGAQEKDS